MRILRLALVNYKRMIKDINIIGFMFLMPLIVIFSVYGMVNKGGEQLNSVNVAFNIEDKGSLGMEMLKELKITKNIYEKDEKASMKLIKDNDVIAVYTIPEDFTEQLKKGIKPVIQSYKVNKGNAVLPLEIKMNEYANKKIKEQILLNNNIIKDKDELYRLKVKSVIEQEGSKAGMGFFLTIFMIIYFIILSSNMIGMEILNMKKQKVLSRAITTSNKGYKIIGGLYLAMFMVQTSVGLAILLMSKFIIGYELSGIYMAIINIILASLVSISLGLFITRIFQNPSIATIVLTLIIVVTTPLGIVALSGDGFASMPLILKNLARFTPQYWLFDSIDKYALFPNSIVVLLMAVALFTAGNLKIRDFINKG